MFFIIVKSGEKFLVDEDDYYKLLNYKWFLIAKKYCYRAKKTNKKQINYLLHREIMGCSPNDGTIVDHINRNPFDCRKSNLRFVTSKENAQNTTSRKKTSRFLGVSYHSCRKKFRAIIKQNGKAYHLGYFENEIEAALLYNQKAKELFGEYASINIIP